MAFRVEPHAEPIAGYKLIERLGGGGFGEVWKAEAPGGLFKAIKFVYGDLQTAGEDDCRAEQELKGLSRVKTVHHPYILSLERFDIIDGQLMIVMELADKTLWDRFRECRTEGLPGISRAELMGYMLETAEEALDLMNTQYQLQHLDIKPQNLFLVYNHIKVADFGLVKDLEGMAGATVTGGVTPVYAAPETFDGRISRFSDQYSLAIVYQELLTGTRPFAGSTMRQLVMQHLQGVPDLTAVPVADRAVLMRSLAKNPDDRYPSCLEMVNALVAVKPPTVTQAPASAPVKEKPEKRSQPDMQATEGLRAGSKKGSVHDSSNTPAPSNREVAEVKSGPPTKVSGDSKPKSTPKVAATPKSEPPKSAPRTTGETRDDATPGILQPAVVIGLGQLGIDTLRGLRQQITEEFGHGDSLPHLRLLAIDTDPDAVQAAGQGDLHSSLRQSEVLNTKLYRPSHYLKGRDGKIVYEGWLDAKMIYRIARQPTSAGARSLGRLAFVDNYRAIYRRLEAELQICCSDDTLHELSRHTDLGLRTRVPRIYVISSLGGTSGGGMFLDVAYLVRQLLRRQSGGGEVVGLFYLPSVGNDPVRMRGLANTYAALTELQHFSSGNAVFRAKYLSPDGSASNKPFTEAGPPFHRCYLMNLPEPRPGSLNSVKDASQSVGQVSEFLYRDLASPLGKELDVRRQQAELGSGPTFYAFGLRRLVWPRKQVLEKAGRKLCRRLIDRWLSKNASAQQEEIKAWAHENWEAQGFRVEDLIEQHQDRCEKLLKETPENLFAQIVNPLAAKLTKTSSKNPSVETFNIGPAVEAMDQIEKLLGIPEECRAKGSNPEPSQMEHTLADAAAAIADNCDKKLAELVVRHLIEEPRYRLAGAEEALRQFSEIVERALQAHEQLAAELNERAVNLFIKIHRIFDAPVSPAQPAPSMWKGAFNRRGSDQPSIGAELMELLKSYPKCRYQTLVLGHITRLYVSMRGLLSDQIREVGFCRQRLTELGGIIDDARLATTDDKLQPATTDKCLLPAGCVDLHGVMKKMETEIGKDELLDFDVEVQKLVQQQFQALVHVCMGPSTIVKSLAPAMIQEAINFLEPLLSGTNVAEMYLARKPAAGEKLDINEELRGTFAEAVSPAIKLPEDTGETAIVSLPGGTSGDNLRTLLHAALPQAYVLTTERLDEILFFREQGPISLKDLEQFGPVSEEAYRKGLAADAPGLHSREDIPEWQNAAEV